MTRPAYLEISGKRYLWRKIIEMRREQLREATPAVQPALFEMLTDVKPDYQREIGRRYAEPSLFDLRR